MVVDVGTVHLCARIAKELHTLHLQPGQDGYNGLSFFARHPPRNFPLPSP